MGSPYLTIDLDKVEHNARTIVAVCEEHGIAVTGVTKGACGSPEVGRAMLRGGVTSLGDSPGFTGRSRRPASRSLI